VTSHEGNYEDYLRWKEAQAAGVPDAVPNHPPAEKATPAGTIIIEGGFEGANGDGSSSATRTRRLNPIKQKQMEERCAFLEEEVPRIEAAIAHTEEELGVYVSAAETQRLTTLAGELRDQLDELTAEWEELMVQLDGQDALSNK
jgi:ATP-binding cassette subfamily F protein 3